MDLVSRVTVTIVKLFVGKDGKEMQDVGGWEWAELGRRREGLGP